MVAKEAGKQTAVNRKAVAVDESAARSCKDLSGGFFDANEKEEAWQKGPKTWDYCLLCKICCMRVTKMIFTQHVSSISWFVRLDAPWSSNALMTLSSTPLKIPPFLSLSLLCVYNSSVVLQRHILTPRFNVAGHLYPSRTRLVVIPYYSVICLLFILSLYKAIIYIVYLSIPVLKV